MGVISLLLTTWSASLAPDAEARAVAGGAAAYHGAVTDNRNEAIYFGAVENVDRQVGRVLDALDEQGLTDETIVLFTSDHGPATLGRGRNLDRNYGISRPYRGNRYGLWDGTDPTQSTDVSAKHPEVSRQFREQLVRSHPSLQSSAIGWRDARPVVPAADQASRDGRPNILFIVSEDNETGEEELYDHERDPHEWNNLVSDEKYAETKRALAGHIPADSSSEVPRK